MAKKTTKQIVKEGAKRRGELCPHCDRVMKYIYITSVAGTDGYKPVGFRQCFKCKECFEI